MSAHAGDVDMPAANGEGGRETRDQALGDEVVVSNEGWTVHDTPIESIVAASNHDVQLNAVLGKEQTSAGPDSACVDEPDSADEFGRYLDSLANEEVLEAGAEQGGLDLVPPPVEQVDNNSRGARPGRSSVYGVMIFRRVPDEARPRAMPLRPGLPPIPRVLSNYNVVPLGSPPPPFPRQGAADGASTFPLALDPIHLHRTRGFIRQFGTGFKSRIAFPREFSQSFRSEILGDLPMVGDSMFPTQVSMVEEHGRLFLSAGWSDFVAAERIARNDIGLFVLVRPFRLVLRLYGSNGIEKPMARRPEPGDPALEDLTQPPQGADPEPFPAAPQAAPDEGNGPNAPVPAHLLGMQYQLGPRVIMSPAIMQLIADVWVNSVTSYPLYVVRLVRTHIYAGFFYFGVQYSTMLPRYQEVTLHYADDDENVYPALLSRSFLGEQVARISSGWFDFVHMNGLHAVEVYVVKMREIAGTLRVRFFPTDD